ncbi:MAG: type II toxin-antitoxin system RelE/ParE family toxin [Nanoarchaeota archaeon]|nr:type II toxin-antitoxin system RelE/ParE family toxin [Nanoarchaeota archaeon]
MFELVVTAGFEEDVEKLRLSHEQIDKLLSKLEKFSVERANPHTWTERVKGLALDIRKFRFGEYRLFLHISDPTIYILAIEHRRECYKAQSLNRIVSIAAKVTGVK